MPPALPRALLLAALATAPAGAVRPPRRFRDGAAPAACGAAAYAEFRRSFGADEALGVENTSESRRALFTSRCEAALAQNARAGSRWRAAVNRFSDRTREELRAHLGHKRAGFREQSFGMPSMSSLPTPMVQSPNATEGLPEFVDWRAGLKSAWHIRDQGTCGSCWAMAAAGAVEMHAELAGGSAETVSALQLLHCVPNPQRCGGSGGCDGATAELAFQFMKQHGVLVERGLRAGPGSSLCEPRGGRRAVVSGLVQLPANRGQPLLEALASHGPVAVGVDATDWFPYHSGIYDACPRNAVVNHAVLAVGYTPHAYVIRNSWGSSWGEAGHIRLLRLGGSGDGYCGVDRSPQEGNGCAGGPSELPVCGMCGVLSDAAFPVGVHFVGDTPPSSGRGSLQPLASSSLKQDLAP